MGGQMYGGVVVWGALRSGKRKGNLRGLKGEGGPCHGRVLVKKNMPTAEREGRLKGGSMGRCATGSANKKRRSQAGEKK